MFGLSFFRTRRGRTVGTLIAIVTALLLTGASCEAEDSSQRRESQSRQSTYDALVSQQPAERMNYSPSRETINFWIRTWDEPDKLSYVYLQNASGDLLGYYVLKGLPVSYCAGLTPGYEFIDPDGGGAAEEVAVPAPGVDGVYYSGAQCNTYFGQDATTGSYIEYTAGLGINVLLYDQPLPRPDVQPLGQTSVEDVN
jgi:hypothetical protein